MKFSVVIPCHNEEDSIGLLLDTLKPLLIAKLGEDWEVILVDDGSGDSTRDLIQAASDLDCRIKGVFLSRAFGHQPAIFAGLGYATGAYVGVIDVHSSCWSVSKKPPPKNWTLFMPSAETVNPATA